METSDLMNLLFALYASLGLHFIIGVIKDTIKNEDNLFSVKYGRNSFINIIIGTISILLLVGGLMGLIKNMI